MARDGLPGEEFQLDFRLVEAGEPVTFTLRGATPEDLFEIFPRYLEDSDPERARQSPAPLQWLDDMPREALAPAETMRYVPSAPGNYLARWTSARYGVETRYFAAIDQSYLIYRPTIWNWPTPFPASGGGEIHNGGLPFDWTLESEHPDAAIVDRLRDEQQRYGGGIVVGLTGPGEDVPANVATLRAAGLDVGRAANLWHGSRLSNERVQLARAAGFDVIDGYVPRADSCGLGAPYYPFYIGPTDHRFPSQSGLTDAVSCVFDFVGSWHFHGPIGFHRPSARGSWERARFALDLAAREAVLTARNSGVHNFITTLINFESPLAWGEELYSVVWDEERGRAFLDEYMHLLAFDHARRWPIVFARATDYADYFRAHYTEMPRRVVCSISHDLDYDRYWTDEWHEERRMPAGYVPVQQSLRAFRDARAMPQYNMPVSAEFINFSDNRRTCRFEHACPKPVHYYDLTGATPWPAQPEETDLPDPEITVTVKAGRDGYEIIHKLTADAAFPDYLLALWDLPRECCEWRLETNAREFIWIENTDGNCRGIVRFDLQPKCTVWLRWLK